MKFSKIACVALLSASISTVALADNNELDNLNKAQEAQKTKEAAYQAVISAVKELKAVGYDKLKDWNGDKTGEGTNQLSAELNTKIYNALEKIKKVKTDIAPDSSNLEIKSGESKLVIENNGDIKLLIKGDGLEAVHGTVGADTELKIVLDNFKAEGGNDNKKSDIAKIFSEKNSALWDKLIAEFTNKHNELKNERTKKINKEAVVLATSTSGIVDPNDQYSAFIDKKGVVENAINVDIKSKQDAVKTAQAGLSTTIKGVDNKLVTLSSTTDNNKIKAQELAIQEILNQLNTAKQKPNTQENNVEKAAALKAAIDAGVKLKRKNAEDTLLTKGDIDAILAGTANKDDFDNDNALDLSGDENKGKVLSALIGEVAQGGAAKMTKDAQTAIEKVTDEIQKVEQAQATLDTSNKLMGDFRDVIAQATSGTIIAATKSTDLKLAIERKDADQIKTAQQELKNAANARATGVTKVANLEEKQGEVLGSFTDTVLANDTVKSIVTTYDAKELADTAKALNTSIEQSQRSQNKGTSTDIIMFNTGLATNTRLAKLSNPFNADLALAQAINELEGETFADAGDSLSSVIKEYTNRFNHDNNLWGNIFGGKGKIKDSANPSIWGVTLGYDKAFDNTIVGGFINYAKVQSKDSQVRSESDNYSFGVYSRSYFDQSEIDAKIGYGFGRNELSRHAMDSKIGTSTGKYDSKFFDVDVEYGYVFGLGNAMFIKPIAGLSYTHIKHDGFTEDGNVPAIFGNTNLKTLKAKLGSEFRVYTDNASYFYITPGVERELSKSTNDLSVKFVGSSKDVVFDADKKKNTYITLKTGAEFKITNNLSTNINFGAKAKAKEQYYNGTLGVSYKF
ncbi:autotransporter outer membrane beta-barrel domain-containing protein [Campylobacter mucosalis]|uniref:Putative autotransporter beta-domain protein n=1 Tax=Campylobacter mucosalis CCUG 21559 TaxID=1032067 RepID=A0A6G5QI14_9BACT|nr:autotransporter outer membrane beta-barrel domain-containing protein [Campylobacter mucosalis]QCD45310.1 putative autotransporter beta-domain protein [Campylobacter mucosalis CCUG 21559]